MLIICLHFTRYNLRPYSLPEILRWNIFVIPWIIWMSILIYGDFRTTFKLVRSSTLFIAWNSKMDHFHYSTYCLNEYLYPCYVYDYILRPYSRPEIWVIVIMLRLNKYLAVFMNTFKPISSSTQLVWNSKINHCQYSTHCLNEYPFPCCVCPYIPTDMFFGLHNLAWNSEMNPCYRYISLFRLLS